MGSWIYDRTINDVTNGTPKGYINYNDFNRIESDIQELVDEMESLSIVFPETLVIKTDWKYQENLPNTEADFDNIPTLAHMQRILHNINVLRSLYSVYPTTPSTPRSMEYATYQTFNDIEKILYDLYLSLHDATRYFRECNTFDCGEYDW